MATYATLADVTDLGVAIDNSDAAEQLLGVCEREVDTIIGYPPAVPRAVLPTFWPGPWWRDPVTGLRVDPAMLVPWQADALARAVARQFEYHIAMGEDFFIRPQPAAVRNPEGGGYDGTLPRIGPAAMRELEQSGLLALSGSVAEGPIRGVYDWQRNLV